MEMTEAIGQRLQYFQEPESATRMLNHPVYTHDEASIQLFIDLQIAAKIRQGLNVGIPVRTMCWSSYVVD